MHRQSRLVGSLIAALGLGLILAGTAQGQPSPRAQVDAIARAIEGQYFDAARGGQIATSLRAAAAKGEFDALTDQRDLATTLTDRLKPLDQHFNVIWDAPGSQPSGPAPAGPRMRIPAAALERRDNYGIRRVEVQPGNVGYIDLRQFAHFEFGRPDQPARQAIEAALQLVAGTDALIIDLRDNGGGSPAMVGYLASAFTPRGADIYNTFRRRDGSDSEAPRDWYASPRLDVPLYILTSARTGSAAEAFAYTLKNAGRAVIVGQTTGGAANPGGAVDVGNGFSVFVSGGSPISPITKTNWEGTGVLPDVDVASAKALGTARGLALEAVIKNGLPEPEATDARWALEALRAAAAPAKDIAAQEYVGNYGAMRVGEENGHLFVQRGRRPAMVLLPLGKDVFAQADEPGRRVIFLRDAQGAVTAFDAAQSSGQSARYRRDEGQGPEAHSP